MQHILISHMVAYMTNKYSQLTSEHRLTIQSMLSQGSSMRGVAAALSVSPSTVSREIKRSDAGDGGWYLAVKGDRSRSAGRTAAGSSRRKLGSDFSSPCWRIVLSGLNVGWSPEQIAGRLKRASSTGDQLTPRVSHETIYNAIYSLPRSATRTELVKQLRQSRAGRRRRTRARGGSRFTGIQNMVPIALRPEEVEPRSVPGHWEGDLIKGAANKSSVGTLVERTSRYVMLVKLDGADARSVLDGFSRRLRSVPEPLRKSMTYDQGTEMSLHQTLAKRLAINIYFCDPHSPWQRGSNENTNGLIREYLPKGSDLSAHSHQHLTSIEATLNNRPRKVLGYRTAAEVFGELLLNIARRVALQV